MSELSAVLPEGWAWANLGELGTWTGGGTPSKANAAFWRAGTVPWVSPKDMKADRIRTAQDFITEAAVASSSAKYVPENSVLMVTRSGILAHTFPVAVNDCRVALNQDLKALTPFHGVDADYVRWYLRSQNSHVLKVTAKHGTTVASIDTDRLHKLQTPIAPSTEQRCIVERIEVLFAELDKGEESLREVRKLLARYRQSVLKAAVTGQLTANWRAENAHRLEHGRHLLARALQERRAACGGRGRYIEPTVGNVSHLPKLPEGWTWATGQQLFLWSSGKFLPKKDIAAGDVPVYGGNGVAGFHSQALVEASTVVIGRVGAQCGNVHLARGPAWITDNAIYATHAPSSCRLDFVAMVLSTANLGSKSKGGAQPFVNQDVLNEVMIPLPSADEQAEVMSRLGAELEHIKAMQDACAVELARSAALRQSILKDAFAGRLVPQDPDDEPAAELLARIRAERATEAPKPRRKAARPSA